MADPIRVEHEGQVFEFPAGTTPEVQQRRIENYFKGASAAQSNSSLEAAAPDELSLGRAVVEAAKNLPSSVGDVVSDTASAIFEHPLDTLLAVGSLATSTNLAVRPQLDAIRNLLGSKSASEPNVVDKIYTLLMEPGDRISGEYRRNYGSWKGFKEHLAKNPAEVLLDASMFVPAGSVAKVPGAAKVGRAATKVAEKIGQGTEAAVQGALGWTTQSGRGAIKEIADAGKRGDTSVLQSLRGKGDMETAVTSMRDAIDDLRARRSQQYVADMDPVLKNTMVLADWSRIDKAVASADTAGKFKGVKLEANPAVQGIRERIGSLIDDWKTLNPESEIFKDVPAGSLTPENFHTPAGLDALKKRIRSEADALSMVDAGFRPAHVYAGKVADAVWKQVSSMDPNYAKAMANYETAEKFIKEATKSLSLGKKASADTALRKIQSLFQNNRNTNFGNREATIRQLLESTGRGDVIGDLAGQQMSSWYPRGIGRLATTAPVVGYMGMTNPAFLPFAATMSPRLMGEASYGYGRALAPAKRISRRIAGNFSLPAEAGQMTEYAFPSAEDE